jgi:indolepyruvate ferredoxin oxidoreductase beta subunit
MDMSSNILICGVGGQGVVLTSKLLARAAMARGEFARTAETIGMAQRGGAVVSHVRIGQSYSPLIPKGAADLILALEPAEAVRCLSYLKPGGAIVASTKAVQPVTAALMGGGFEAEEMLRYLASKALLIPVDTEGVCRVAGSNRAANMALLGAAAASGTLGFELSEIEAILTELGGKFLPVNLNALRLGAEAITKGEARP